jgi:hypothetical protein
MHSNNQSQVGDVYVLLNNLKVQDKSQFDDSIYVALLIKTSISPSSCFICNNNHGELDNKKVQAL